MSTKKAVVLLSGGLDSATILALAHSQGYECYALSFSYQQRHSAELQAAKKQAALYAAQHVIIDLDLSKFTSSALTNKNIEVPVYSGSNKIPVTYVPARNTIFLSIALGWAEALGAYDIFIGVSCVDYSGYPDCRPEYIESFRQMAKLATKTGVEGNPIQIHTPLIYLSKAQTIQLGVALGVNYSQTVSCYQADDQGRACGHCDSCFLRQAGFKEAETNDPTLYQNNSSAS